MPFLNNHPGCRKQLARLTALTLLFSYVEMILPRFIPFFRLGLANTVILLSFEIDFGLYYLLSVFKAIASSLMSGTLFSPFFIISLLQSVASALVMRLAYKLISKRVIGFAGISVLGAAVSAIVQICLSSLYLGKGTFSLLGPMLIFNTVSGVLVAFLAQSEKIKSFIKEDSEELSFDSALENKKTENQIMQILFVIALVGFSASLFFIKNLYVLFSALTAGLILQKICGRKILLIPYLSLWLFIFISTAFVPNGEVLFRFWKLSVTKGALMLALQKALTLSAVSALSQCAVCLKPPADSLLSQILNYYRLMSDSFRKSYKGSIKSCKPCE